MMSGECNAEHTPAATSRRVKRCRSCNQRQLTWFVFLLPAACSCDEPARPSTPQPGTPTISESNYRLPYMKSRLSATSSSETHLSDGSTCTPVPQPCTAAARGVPKCQAAGGTPKGSKIPVLSPQLPEQLQRAIRLEAARLREVARMADAVLAPSRLDFTPLRHKYTATPAAAAH